VTLEVLVSVRFSRFGDPHAYVVVEVKICC
jgi:hypothetical protein